MGARRSCHHDRPMPTSGPDPRVVRRRLLAWFSRRRRSFPWRETRDPYRTLVAEVMLQQTQTGRVVPAYEAFLRLFPTIESLAAAPVAGVIRAWKGLGYNRRAVSLQRTARRIVAVHDGMVPRDPAALRELPGIGEYTASAVACFAFDRQVAVVDTNVRRVLARIAHGRDPEYISGRTIADTARAWLPAGRAYEWNQALMDLGATVCRSRMPACGACPLARWCRWKALAAGARDVQPKERFAGSRRQMRGAIVERLRRAGERGVSVRQLSAALPGRPRPSTVAAILAGLESDGLVRASPAARKGSAGGLVRLP